MDVSVRVWSWSLVLLRLAPSLESRQRINEEYLQIIIPLHSVWIAKARLSEKSVQLSLKGHVTVSRVSAKLG